VRGGSIGCIEELWKRKREEEEREGFSKSNKTIRLPKDEKEDKSGAEERRGKEEGGWMEWKEEMEKMMKGIIIRRRVWESGEKS